MALRAAQAAARAGAAASNPAASASTQVAVSAADPATAASAVDGLGYLEAAFRSGTVAAEAAKHAASVFGSTEIKAVTDAGADQLVQQIERLKPTSELLSRGGHKYLRELVEALRGQR